MNREQKIKALRKAGYKPCTTCPDSVIDELYNKIDMSHDQLKRWKPAKGIAEKYKGIIHTQGIDPFRLNTITDARIDQWYKQFPQYATMFFEPVGELPKQDVDYTAPEKLEAHDFEVIHMQDEPEAEQPETNEPEIDATNGAIKLAEANGIDLSEVTGTGAGGRITKKDVEALID